MGTGRERQEVREEEGSGGISGGVGWVGFIDGENLGWSFRAFLMSESFFGVCCFTTME